MRGLEILELGLLRPPDAKAIAPAQGKLQHTHRRWIRRNLRIDRGHARVGKGGRQR